MKHDSRLNFPVKAMDGGFRLTRKPGSPWRGVRRVPAPFTSSSSSSSFSSSSWVSYSLSHLRRICDYGTILILEGRAAAATLPARPRVGN
ncbi:hypothetical protein E2C01_039138 [Portunus trituberculatus]|uniref:Uncharacterized protein n=1 Tax=Portunus trituberculatus TaxID=210409 RepID=A0A5B7FJU9_PORTR|nr:hypothetical protein [Portunus trituberculatus]